MPCALLRRVDDVTRSLRSRRAPGSTMSVHSCNADACKVTLLSGLLLPSARALLPIGQRVPALPRSLPALACRGHRRLIRPVKEIEYTIKRGQSRRVGAIGQEQEPGSIQRLVV